MNGLQYALDDWYPVSITGELAEGEMRSSRLLGTDITLCGGVGDSVQVSCGTKALQTRIAFDHVWITLSDAPRSLFEIPEALEPERRFVPCGVVRVKCSPLRAVENFLDIAHFPYVHTNVLGAEPHTEVYAYDVHIDDTEDEVIASNIRFYQPQASKSAEGGIQTEYVYRVPAPMAAILYKTCPPKPDFMDVIALFVQPLDEETCDVWPWMALYDDVSSQAELIQFQQLIFLQDRSILENQMPRKLPIDPRLEIPTRADLTSVAYRRWLKRRGAFYGAIESA
ncbi:MAG: aromatic ring-hydroxylating dioxygenase subunit alpha [Granulosicoccus sp.]|nr:aromatic ring-hydroxylating dioxygenase subunit alpha [Granulosicoccus sp.]